MGKKRIYEFAKELHLPSKKVVEAAKKAGLDVKNHMSAVDDSGQGKIRAMLKTASGTTKPKVSTPTHTRPMNQKPVVAHPKHQQATTNQTQNTSTRQGTRMHGQANATNRNQTNRNNGNQNNRRAATTNNASSGRPVNSTRNSTNNHSNNNTNNHSQNRGQSNNQTRNSQNQGNNNRNNTQNRNNSQNRNNNRNTTRTNTQTTAQSRNNTTNSNNTNRTNNNNGQNRNNSRGNSWNNRNSNNRFNNNNRRRNNRKNRRRDNTPKKVMPARKDRPLPDTLVYTEGMNAQDLGKILHREPAEIVKKLFMLGVMTNQNQSLDKETIELLATDYGINAQEKVTKDITDLDKIFDEENHNDKHLVTRPPVVTIMGHVDHGKTTLLDRLRHTHVTEEEAGGITQHIGAYQVKIHDRMITFLDTPGHAAFSNMRARGADVTDIIILVVAADDGVMPQTIEAINHAKAAHAPIIVAVNKIDKPGANPNHVMEQLTEYGLIPEDWGGDTIFVQISAKFGKNIDQLLEMVLLEADMLELKANPDQRAVGTVLEARLDKGKGPVGSLLVQQGTLHVGDPIVVGHTFGRVRVMINDRGRRVKAALPSEPVEITGLNEVPDAADKFVVYADEKTARTAGEERAKTDLQEERAHTNHVTLDNLFESMKEGEIKEVDVIIKADVQGSVEALANSLNKIEVKGVRVNIIHKAVGAINESDVTLAAASHAIIIGFNVRPTATAKSQADMDNVDIRLYDVIYNAIEEVESAMKGMLEPTYQEKVTGTLSVRKTYKVSKIGTVVGAFVDSGYITKDSGVRLIRNGIVVYQGKLASLKRFKDDVKEVRQGYECGLTIENYNDIKVDDQIEAYVMEEVPVK